MWSPAKPTRQTAPGDEAYHQKSYLIIFFWLIHSSKARDRSCDTTECRLWLMPFEMMSAATLEGSYCLIVPDERTACLPRTMVRFQCNHADYGHVHLLQDCDLSN